MFKNFFRLSYVMKLQDKYQNSFKLKTSFLFVLPPTFKRVNFKTYLVFPVVNRISYDKISRPIGVIFVDRFGKEKIFDFEEYEMFSSKDFSKTYTYFVGSQEKIKNALEILSRDLSQFAIIEKRVAIKEYKEALKSLFSQDFYNFYKEIETNKIVEITNDLIKTRKNPSKEEVLPKTYENALREKMLVFLKKEMLPSLRGRNAILKLRIYEKMGEFLKSYKNSLDITKDEEVLKFEFVKIYAKVINSPYDESVETNFISRLIIMILNAQLLERKNGKLLKQFEDEIKECNEVILDEIKLLSDVAKSEVEHFLNCANADHKRTNIKNLSNLSIGHSYIFR